MHPKFRLLHKAAYSTLRARHGIVTNLPQRRYRSEHDSTLLLIIAVLRLARPSRISLWFRLCGLPDPIESIGALVKREGAAPALCWDKSRI